MELPGIMRCFPVSATSLPDKPLIILYFILDSPLPRLLTLKERQLLIFVGGLGFPIYPIRACGHFKLSLMPIGLLCVRIPLLLALK